MPGLSGGNNNLYTISLLRSAQKKGFKCGTVLFRGSSGIPITSSKLSCSVSWFDAQAITEYCVKEYVVDKETGKKTRNIYAYGCSLGANILGLYLAKVADKCPLDGSVLYATPWDLTSGSNFFYTNMFGIYAYAVGMNLSRLI